MYNILILEDEEFVRFSLVNHFEDYEFNVFSAESSEKAIEIIKNNHIDAAIVDLRLPGKSGDEFILEAYSLNENTVFIIHSGSTDYDMPYKLKDLDRVSDVIFRKPLLDLIVLNKEIEKMLQKD